MKFDGKNYHFKNDMWFLGEIIKNNTARVIDILPEEMTFIVSPINQKKKFTEMFYYIFKYTDRTKFTTMRSRLHTLELKKKIDEPMTLEHFSMWLEKFKKEVGYYEWLEKQKAMN